MSENSIELRGFEEAFLVWLGGVFRFSELGLRDVPLTVGRTFFANFMPEPSAIAQTAAGAVPPYDLSKEPTISVYTNASPGVRASLSRWAKHETSLQFVLRFPGAFERSKGLLEEVIKATLNKAKGKRMGGFICKAATLTQRPTAFQRQNDDRSFAQATVRFLYVALNQ